MLGVWVLQVWEKLGKPSKFQLLELGPGKGTLMQDVLRTTSHFPEFMKGVSVHLCETSPTMREEQVRALHVRNVAKEIDRVQAQGDKLKREQAREALKASVTKTMASTDAAAGGKPLSDAQKTDLMMQAMSAATPIPESPDVLMHGEIPLPLPPAQGASTSAANGEDEDFGYVLYADDPPERAEEVHRLRAAARAARAALPPSVPIHWHSKISQVPVDQGPLIVLAHEFFDALPVYQFVLTERGWCEKMVDSDEGRGPHHLRFVLSAQPTLASRTFMPADRFPPQDGRIGDAVEVCAAGLACMEDLSRRLSAAGGAALVIDYGTNHPNPHTLQAVQKHAFKHVLEEPGQVDLTALVDFKSLRATVERTNKLISSPPLKVLPLVTQSHFLRNLHIAARLEALVQAALARGLLTEAQVETLISNATRMVDPSAERGGMGQHFKVMCVVSEQLAKEDIVPFDLADEIMIEEDRVYELARAQARAGSSGNGAAQDGKPGRGLLDVQLPPYADPPPSTASAAAAAAAAAANSTEHAFSSAPKPKLSTPVVPKVASALASAPTFSSSSTSRSASASTPSSSTASSSTAKRREAARQAAEELARARQARQQAEAAAADAAAGKK